MNYPQSITFFRDDPRWQTKVLIGLIVALASVMLSVVLIGLAGFVLLGGYGVRLMQNVRDGAEYPLPEWDNWGGDFVRGLKLTVIGIVWALPIFVFLFLYMGSFMAVVGVSAWFEEPVGLAFMPVAYCMLGLMIVYSLVVSFFTPGFITAFAEHERIGAGFQLGKIWRWLKANLGQVIIVVLLVLGGGSVIQQIAFFGGILLCFVGLFVTIPLSIVVYLIFSFHLYGQLAREHPFTPITETTETTETTVAASGGEGEAVEASEIAGSGAS